jgi:ParB family transcriptional regulator, chromosome partitioning protein
MSQNNSKRALGRGLKALLENPDTDITTSALSTDESPKLVGTVSNISIAQIEANPFQPRTTFEKEALFELTKSITLHGIIQPVTVRKIGYDKFQLISGERRFKAAQLAGLTEIPAYIRVANDEGMLELALIENIHRENLDAIEIAISFKRLLEECRQTHEQLSERLGRDRSTITNYLRLLKLPPEVQLGIRQKQITMGHARALVNVSNEEYQLFLFKEIVENDLSVRQVETLVRNDFKPALKEKESSGAGATTALLPEQFQKIKDDLSKKTSSKVQIKTTPKGKGSIVIKFRSEDDLLRIVKSLGL